MCTSYLSRILFINSFGKRFSSTFKRKNVSNIVNLHILGSNTSNSVVNAVLRLHDPELFSFNCTDGYQRLCIEVGLTLPDVDYVFLTNSHWNHFAGLLSLFITKRESKLATTIFGPKCVEQQIKNLVPDYEKITFTQSIDDIIIENNSIKIKSIPLDEETIAYSVLINKYQGKFNIEKCVDDDVPVSVFRQLDDGFDVTLDDGRLIKSVDYHERASPKQEFIVLDIPNAKKKHLLNNSRLLDEVQNKNFVLHLSPNEIIESDDYQNFLKDCPPETMHALSTKSSKFSGFISANLFQQQLNEVDKLLFPLLRENIPTNMDIEDSPIRSLNSHQIYSFRPKLKIIERLQTEAESKKSVPDEDAKQLIQNYNNKFSQHFTKNSIEIRSKMYPKIIFLGTGSGFPNKLRNSTGILVHLNDKTTILLDCGEGTLGQIYRFYGEETKVVLSKLKMIFISHKHYDHFAGTLSMLNELKKIQKQNQKLWILAPPNLEEFLNILPKTDNEIKYEFVSNNEIMKNREKRFKVTNSLGLYRIDLCFVRHILNACAISLSMNRPETNLFKLTFTGDCMPTEFLTSLGRNSTVLIHEATFEDGLEDAARAKNHSTISEAIEQGVKMNAKYTILTHFSQRYKIPFILKSLPKNVSIAFDNMEIVESDLERSHYLYETMKPIFAESIESSEKRAYKRNLSKNWKNEY